MLVELKTPMSANVKANNIMPYVVVFAKRAALIFTLPTQRVIYGRR